MNDRTQNADRGDGDGWLGQGGNTRLSQSGDDCSLGSLASLIHAVELDVIPNLLTAYRRPERANARATERDVAMLSTLMLSDNVPDALRLIEQLRDQGLSIESIYLDLLGATARNLGEMWDDDRIGFIDVTIGLCALHQVLFRLAPRFEQANPVAGANRHALFVPTPGETHFFGALIAAKVFAQAGWQCWTEVAISSRDLVALVKSEDFSLVGLSLATDRHAEELAIAIAAVRRATQGRAVKVIVGGTAFVLDPELGARVGADGVVTEAQAGIRMVDALFDRRQGTGRHPAPTPPPTP